MWTELQIHTGEADKARIFEAEADIPGRKERAFIARLSGAAGNVLPGEFFHESNAGVAPVRFGGFPAGIRIYGVGAQGVDLVESHGSRVRRLVSDWAGRPLMEVRNSGDNALRPSRRLIAYRIPRLVFQRSRVGDRNLMRRVADRYTGGPEDLAIPEIREAILHEISHGLARQATDLHGHDPRFGLDEHGESLDILEIPWEIVSVGRFRQERVSGGARAPVFGLAAVELVVRGGVDLEGVWHVGRLAARGYGQMHRIYGRAA